MSFFSLLPDALSQLAALAGPPAAGGTRRHVGFGVDVLAGNSTAPGGRVTVGADVLGAGDVVGIDPRMIARVEPAAAATEFEPNYFPFLEFVDSDFPWRFTLRSDAAGRRLPWLVLLALKPDEFEFSAQGNGPLPVVRILEPARTLPDLAQSWAFAHMHLAHPGEQAATDLGALIASRPDLHFSRLMAPRKLEPNTAYTLALVPSTEAGRLTGLGKTDKPAPFDALAWAAGTAAGLELPVYFQSRFTTSVLADFELLVRRLQPYHADAHSPVAAPVEAFAGAPGYYAGYANAHATFEVQDALIQPTRAVQPFNTDPALSARLKVTLESEIAGELVGAAADGPNQPDPLVAMPPYGWRFSRQTQVDATQAAQGRVVDRINLDLKFRHAAGLGAEVVRRNQEKYAALCWDQYAEVVAANQAVGRLRLARELGAIMARRHVARLDPQVALALAEPALGLAMAAPGVSVAGLLAQSGVPASFASRALRRSAAKRTARPAAAAGTAAIAKVPMPTLPGTRPPPAPQRPDVARTLAPLATLTAVSRSTLVTLIGPELNSDPPEPPPRAIAVTTVQPASLSTALTGLFASLPTLKAQFRLPGLGVLETQKLDPIMRAPVIPDPLVEPLKAFASRSILRATDAMPNNSVAVVKENRAFVEAFLVGASHEMNNELRWREFPVDMRGTIFARFWNRKQPASDPTGDDIAPIHGWTQPLGANYPPHDTDRKEALVVLLRGDLVRRFDNILVVVNHAATAVYQAGHGTDSPPVFSGRLGNDLAYYGFDVARDTMLADKTRYFFQIYEAPGKVRFGLDIGSAQVRRDRFQYRTAALPFPLATLGRNPLRSYVPAHLITGHPAAAHPATWDALSWSNMTLDGAGFIDFVATNPQVGEAPNYWSATRDAATLARSFWQKPIAAVLPATRVL
jgi:hypothetical protein